MRAFKGLLTAAGFAAIFGGLFVASVIFTATLHKALATSEAIVLSAS